MGILDSILGRREPPALYRTIDGGHPAPYPDMTDEQLYNYELAFNVPKKTFSSPPASVRPPNYEDRNHGAGKAASPTVRVARSGRKEPRLYMHDDTMFEEPGPVLPTVPRGSAEPDSPAALDQHVDTGLKEEDQPAVEEAEPAIEEEGPVLEKPAPPADDLPPLDLTRPVRTVTTKQTVEIITTRARHPIYKVHGYIGNDEVVTVFTVDGRLSENGPRFLENVPERQELHLNIYPNPDPSAADRFVLSQHDSKEAADASAQPGRLACVRVQFDL